ncbi:hypothetical protein HAL07_05250 [Helicobacter ailurogastricus]|uniref:Uncharacterized protein n=1 Tax=Helicobacter ailurogastricus TaxID=1578720 RepID=A0A0K2Y3I7_9HELI|nr:hypothetical protein HAL07_05250 [Helicobacter ailurogastricus]
MLKICFSKEWGNLLKKGCLAVAINQGWSGLLVRGADFVRHTPSI